LNKYLNIFKFILFQLFFLLILIIFECFFYYSLPPVINIVVGFFLFPIVLFILMHIFFNLYLKISDDTLTIISAITALTLWIPICISMGATKIPDYIFLYDVSPPETRSYGETEFSPNNKFIKMKNFDLLGNKYMRTAKKTYNSGKRSYEKDYFYVIPITSDSVRSSNIKAWMYYTTDSYKNKIINIKKILKGSQKLEIFEGIKVYDPFDVSLSKKLIKKAVKKFSLSSEEDATVYVSRGSYEEIFFWGKKSLVIALSIIILIYLVIPAVYLLRKKS